MLFRSLHAKSLSHLTLSPRSGSRFPSSPFLSPLKPDPNFSSELVDGGAPGTRTSRADCTQSTSTTQASSSTPKPGASRFKESAPSSSSVCTDSEPYRFSFVSVPAATSHPPRTAPVRSLRPSPFNFCPCSLWFITSSLTSFSVRHGRELEPPGRPPWSPSQPPGHGNAAVVAPSPSSLPRRALGDPRETASSSFFHGAQLLSSASPSAFPEPAATTSRAPVSHPPSGLFPVSPLCSERAFVPLVITAPPIRGRRRGFSLRRAHCRPSPISFVRNKCSSSDLLKRASSLSESRSTAQPSGRALQIRAVDRGFETPGAQKAPPFYFLCHASTQATPVSGTGGHSAHAPATQAPAGH